MARPRITLYSRVLLWFMANLLLLVVLGYGFMRMQFRPSMDWMLAGPGGERIEQLAGSLFNELRVTVEPEWGKVLKRFQTVPGPTLTLFGNDGQQKLGPPLEVPNEVRVRLLNKRVATDMPPPPHAGQKPSPLPVRPRSDPPPPKPRFLLHTDQPPLYWAGIDIPLAYGEGEARKPLTMVLASESLTAGGLFFNPWPWVALAAIAITLSALVWLPMVAGITREIRRLNEAAHKVAHGAFDVRLPETRQDELGELASSVNAMAQQLIEYVEQQRRITRDVAHELCSPIARMQMALGVVEQRATPEQMSFLEDLDDELQHMAKLVEEVLAFSKADTLSRRAEPEEIDLSELIDKVIAREADGLGVQVEAPPGLRLRTLREALDRALGNVLRNAVRYASDGGPIKIQASAKEDRVTLCVTDEGPGVPPDALPRLFEPFFRPEAARARHTGGSGLGLAIVKRSVEACGGTVTAHNRQPHGLMVSIELNAKS